MKKIPLFIYLLALAKSSLFSFFGFGLVDEGQSLHNSLKILHGGLPYKDFFAVFPPLHYYFYALPLWLFGESIVIPRLFSSVVFAFSPVFIYLTLKRLIPKSFAIIPAVLLLFSNVNVERFYFMSFIFVGIYFLTIAFETEQNKHYLISGLVFGVSSLFRLDITGVFVLAGATTIFVININKFKIAKLKTLCFFLGTFVSLSFLIIWLFINNLTTIFWNNAVVEAILITKIHKLPFPSITNVVPHALNLSNLSESYTAIYGYSIIFSYLIVTLLLITRKIVASKIVGVLLLSGYLLIPYMLGRPDMGHLIKAGIPFFFLGPIILSRAFSNKSKPLIFMASSIIFVIFLGGIAESLYWIKLNNFQIEIRQQKLRINSTYTKGTTLPSAQTLTEASGFLRGTSGTVAALPYMAGLYYLSGKTSATRYDNLLNGYLVSLNQENQFVINLEKAVVKRIVYDPDGGPQMAVKSMRIYNHQIHEYLVSKYNTVRTTPEGWLFLERK